PHVIRPTLFPYTTLFRSKGRRLLDQMSMLPLVFLGIVMGIAILKMYLMSPVPVYGTIWILVLAFTARYLPYGIRFSHSALLSLQDRKSTRLNSSHQIKSY